MSLLGKLMISVGMDTSGIDKGVKDADKKTKTLGDKVSANVKKYALMGAAAGAVATVGFVGASVRSFAALEKGMNEVFTLMPGMSDTAMGAMTKDLQAFDQQFGVLSGESVPALYQAISAGVPAGGVFDFLEIAQRAATGGVTDLATAVEGITSVVNAYGEEVMSSTEASDAMFTAVQLGSVTMEELASNVSKVTPIASALGVSFDDVMAATATLASQGVPTEVAMTNLSQAFSELAKTGSVADEAFQAVAGKSFKAFIEGGGNVSEAFSLIADGAKLSDKELVDMFGSIEAGKAVMGLTGNGAETFADITEAMGNKAGATDLAYEQMAKGLSFSFDMIKASGQVLMQHLGERLAPAFQRLADWVNENMPEIQAAFDDALSYIGDTVIPAVVTAFHQIVAWWKDNGPQVKRDVAAVAGAIWSFLETVKDVVRWVGRNWSTISTVISTVWNVCKTPLSLMATYTRYVMTAGKDVVEWFGSKWSGITGFISGVWNNVSGILSSMKDAIQDVISAIGILNSTHVGSQKVQSGLAEAYGGGQYKPPSGNYRPRAAEGGNVSMSGGVLIGERGPEILNLPRGARVTPLDKAGGGITVHIENLYANSPRAAGEKISEVIDNAQRQMFRKRRLAPVMA